MTIRNNEEMRRFEKAIDRCHNTVWVITPEGEEYDLKTPMGRHLGMARLLNPQEDAEPELFASSYEDEAILFDYFRGLRQAA